MLKNTLLHTQSGKSLTFYLGAIALCLGIGISANFLYSRGSAPAPTPQATILEEPRQLPEFLLLGHNGQPFKLQHLEGEWSLWFFGFTNCPDVCPTTLSTMAQAIDLLDEDKRPQMVFVSLDPERDTPERIENYAKWFNRDFVGVTGPLRALETITEAMGVAWQRVPGESDSDYQIDHSSWLMLVNPNGQLVAYFAPPHLPTQIASAYKSITNTGKKAE